MNKLKILNSNGLLIIFDCTMLFASDNFAIWVGAVCGAGMTIIFMAGVMPFLKKKVLAEHAAM